MPDDDGTLPVCGAEQRDVARGATIDGNGVQQGGQGIPEGIVRLPSKHGLRRGRPVDDRAVTLGDDHGVAE